VDTGSPARTCAALTTPDRELRTLKGKVPRIDPAAQGDDQTRSAVAAKMRRRRWGVNAIVIMAASIWDTADRRQWPRPPDFMS
jgi:hypothetical protein